MEYGLLFLLVLCALALLRSLIPSGKTPMQEFEEDCRRQGMSFEETQAASSIRIAFVRLRRKASDLCIERDGDISRKRINDIAGLLAIGLAAAHGEEAAKSFIGWVDSCPDDEILYEDARDMSHQHNLKEVSGYQPPAADPQLLQDIHDAFKVR